MAVIPQNVLSKVGPLTEADLKALEQQISATTGSGGWHVIEKGQVAVVVAANHAPILTGTPPASPPGGPFKSDDQLRQEMTNNVALAGHAPAYLVRLINEVRSLQKQLTAVKNPAAPNVSPPSVQPPATSTSNQQSKPQPPTD